MTDVSAAPATARIRIMVVEDEPDIGVIIMQMLSSHYEVVHAANGLEALERLNWYQPDLTIMDLMMPVLDGFDTTRAIKKDNDYAAMPVMFLTARKDNKAVREALMAGGDVYLEKPFDPPELLIRLKEMVERNNLTPKHKMYTLSQIKAHFEDNLTAAAPRPVMPGVNSLTEQLARAAAEPKARVLLVNDSEDTLKAAKNHLRNRYEVLVCSDPETALDKILAYQPDILVLSEHMSCIDSGHFLQLLRVNRHLTVPHYIFLNEANDMLDSSTSPRRMVGTVAGQPDLDRLQRDLAAIISQPGFERQRKRLDYREIIRREESTNDT